jgi:hypothetical protein
MASKAHKPSRNAASGLAYRAGDNPQHSLCSAWIDREDSSYPWTSRLEGLAIGGTTPEKLSKAFLGARYWSKHWFIGSVLQLRFSFFHYGFAIKSEDKSAATAVKNWEKNNRKMYRRYARDCWREWLVQSNTVALWGDLRPPMVFRTEDCKFEDAFGIEKLTVNHRLTSSQIAKMKGLSRKEAAQLISGGGRMVLTHDAGGFDFAVVKREAAGWGFGWPDMMSLFDCTAQLQSLEVGDAALAQACRLVIEQHKLGHEIKAGMHSGSPAHFWTPKRQKAVESMLKGKTGHVRVTTNFDHTIDYPRPKPEAYAASRYESGITRLALWSMPLGQMVLMKSLNPYLLPLLKFQALSERDIIGEHMREVFIEALGAPDSTKITWSNECFNDSRIAADLIKFGLQSGPVSQGTFLEAAGCDQETEVERKKFESNLPKEAVEPIYDAAHGKPDKGQPGRKRGTKDGEGK